MVTQYVPHHKTTLRHVCANQPVRRRTTAQIMTVVVITNPIVNPGNAIVLANALPIHTVPPSMDTVNMVEVHRAVQLIWETFVSVKSVYTIASALIFIANHTIRRFVETIHARANLIQLMECGVSGGPGRLAASRVVQGAKRVHALVQTQHLHMGVYPAVVIVMRREIAVKFHLVGLMVDGQIGWPGLPVQFLVGQECKHALACAATLFLATAEVTVLGTCTRHRRVPQQLVEG